MTPIRSLSTGTIVVALAVLATIAVVAAMVIIVRNEPAPVDPTPEPTIPAASTPIATPEVTEEVMRPQLPLVTVQRVDRGTLPELLRYAPDRLADDSLPLSDVLQYADIDGWMRARDVSTPSGPDDPAFAEWDRELDNLAIPGVLVTRGNDDIWEETYGFRLSDVNQVLAVGQAPDFVLVMRGDFNADELHAAWVEAGYQAVRSEGRTLWSLFPGDAVDLSSPASRPALGNMNNVILLDDGTLIATSRIARLEQVIRVVNGASPSLVENPRIAALLPPATYPHRLQTAIVLRGTALAIDPATPVVIGTPEPVRTVDGATPVATQVPEASLPRADLMLAGMDASPRTFGEPTFTLVLTYEEPSDAVLATIRAGWGIHHARSPVTGQPYHDRIEPHAIRTHVATGDRHVLYLTARLPEGPADWRDMLEDRDLGFVMWPWEP